MDNEKAIKILRKGNPDIKRYATIELATYEYDVEAYNEALNLAIEALEDRPQGEWIEKVERRGCFAGDKTVYSYTCPFCGVKEFKKYPFCHCGAELRGSDKK